MHTISRQFIPLKNYRSDFRVLHKNLLAAERFARWAWRARGDIKRVFRKKAKDKINAKSEPSKCSGLAISRRRQIYAMIGVELRPQG